MPHPDSADPGSPVDQLAHVSGHAPSATAALRTNPEDFLVNERLSVERSGEGEHLWIEVEKKQHTTPQIAKILADHFTIQIRDVGYSGLKDKHAITRQWFSVATPESGENLPEVSGVRWLTCERHSRKLRRGTHDGNAFILTLRDVVGERDAIDADLARLRDQGMPNYFGEQRFADGRNIEAARRLFNGARLKRTARSMALSATRSWFFNAILSERVYTGSWNTLLPGEAVMLNASHSVFPWPTEPQERAALDQRLHDCDIHPSGLLPGSGTSMCTAQALELEDSICAQHPDLVEGLKKMGVKQARRALRVLPINMTWSWPDANILTLTFGLPSGAFATALLRECLLVYEPHKQSPRNDK